ncbi:hypothetical protein CAP35_04150 [Chitinophagaceae bacterium IBVUCB1]|nr:hypothetical protein CAP35_04150 [Chitinophagaceae bacterium IBVUCB1]
MKLKQTHVMYAIVTSIVLIVFGLIIQVMHMSNNKALQYLGMLPLLIAVILNAMAYSKANEANVSFKNVFGSCFKMVLIITGIVLVWSFISLQIFPEIKTQAMEQAMAEMEKSNMPEEQMEMGLSYTEKFFTPIVMGAVLFMYLFWGAVFSLIGAAVAKKNPVQQQLQP